MFSIRMIKKWLIVLALAVMTISLPFAMNTEAASSNSNLNSSQVLRVGANGHQVLKLQQILANQNDYHHHLDGIYGYYTQKAVKKYQEKHGLKVDGIAGPHTIGSMKNIKSTHVSDQRNLEIGDSGGAVRTVQTKLKSLGYYSYGIDGIFGPITKEAVKSFQETNGLAVDGIVGRHTSNALYGQNAQSRNHSSQQRSHSSKSTSHHSIQSSATNVSTSNHSTEILSTAKSLIGVPYKWGGTTPSGFDCSGFIDYVFGKLNINLPRTASGIYHYGSAVSHLQPGDLVFFVTYKKGPSHVGIYVGSNQFIHADADRGIMISSMSLHYWKSRYLGAKRISH